MSVWQKQLPKNIWLIGVRGRIDQTLSPKLEETLVELLEQGHSQLIVDMGEATYINSGGLRCLVSAWRRAKKQNGDLFICRLNTRLDEIFNIIGFDKVFQIFTSVEEAQKGFFDKTSELV